MNLGLSAALSGTADGVQRYHQQQEQQRQQQRLERRQDVEDQYRADDRQYLQLGRSRERKQWEREDEEVEFASSVQNAMLRAEAAGDISGLVEVYNDRVPSGNRIVDYDMQPNGNYRFKLDDGQEVEHGSEYIMGLGASLLQPGTLTAMKQAAASAQAEHSEKLSDREFEKWKIGQRHNNAVELQKLRQNGRPASNPFTKINLQNLTDESREKVVADYEQTGSFSLSDIDFRSGDNAAHDRALKDAVKRAQDVASDMIEMGGINPIASFVRRSPQDAEAAGINESMGTAEAIRKLENYLFEMYAGDAAGETNQTGSGSDNGLSGESDAQIRAWLRQAQEAGAADDIAALQAELDRRR